LQSLKQRTKIYFASDFHLGLKGEKNALFREKLIISWLDSIARDAEEIYLLGDLFDFWFEYKHVVPKGNIRFLAKIAELCDKGIKITVFKGNHDMWMFGYLEKELGVSIISDELVVEKNGKKFFLHHGDGLGPGDYKYKLLKKVFRNRFFQALFRLIHPDVGISMARFFSKKSRTANFRSDQVYKGDDKEYLVQYILNYGPVAPFDYFIFGHRHLPIEKNMSNGCLYVNLGEWFTHFTYAEFDGIEIKLKTYTKDLLA
jgi:UDP-2,3-diacylglucosamine hydrolase